MAKLFRVEHMFLGASSQDALNRYWYHHAGNEDIAAEQVADVFADTVAVAWKAISSIEWTQTAIFVAEVLVGADAHLLNLTNGAGVQGGDAEPSFTQWSFFLKPVGPILKKGGKRIGGVADPWTDDDLATSAALPALSALAQILALGLETEEGVGVFPAIVRETATSFIISELVGAAYRQISTMDTRKLSRAGGTTGLIARAPATVATLAMSAMGGVTDIASAVTAVETVRDAMFANTSPSEFTYAK